MIIRDVKKFSNDFTFRNHTSVKYPKRETASWLTCEDPSGIK